MYSLIQFGDKLSGHPKVVHGGLTSTMFDNSFGWLFISLGKPAAVTANLNVDFRKPVYAGSVVLLKTQLMKEEGRKLYMKGTMETADGTVLAESTSLFITIRKRFMLLRKLQSIFESLVGSGGV